MKVDSDLNDIMNNGRQFFIEKQPINVSKILHDYSADRKDLLFGKIYLKKDFIDKSIQRKICRSSYSKLRFSHSYSRYSHSNL